MVDWPRGEGPGPVMCLLKVPLTGVRLAITSAITAIIAPDAESSSPCTFRARASKSGPLVKKLRYTLVYAMVLAPRLAMDCLLASLPWQGCRLCHEACLMYGFGLLFFIAESRLNDARGHHCGRRLVVCSVRPRRVRSIKAVPPCIIVGCIFCGSS